MIKLTALKTLAIAGIATSALTMTAVTFTNEAFVTNAIEQMTAATGIIEILKSNELTLIEGIKDRNATITELTATLATANTNVETANELTADLAEPATELLNVLADFTPAELPTDLDELVHAE